MFDIRKDQSGAQKAGVFFDLDSALAIECIALSGFHFAIVDLEHGPLNVQAAVELICRGKLHGMSVLVRSQDFSRTAILKPLDAGADGVVVPGIRTVDEAKQAIAFGKYYPIGERGVAQTRASSYGCDQEVATLLDLFTVKNRQAKLFLQCETTGCLEKIEEIAALDGVDGILIGPYDLSTDMGLAGEFGHERMISALNRIKNACRSAGRSVLIFSPNAQDAKRRFDEGYDAVAVATASRVLIDGCRHLLKEAINF